MQRCIYLFGERLLLDLDRSATRWSRYPLPRPLTNPRTNGTRGEMNDPCERLSSSRLITHGVVYHKPLRIMEMIPKNNSMWNFWKHDEVRRCFRQTGGGWCIGCADED